jgi:hypothetical protein
MTDDPFAAARAAVVRIRALIDGGEVTDPAVVALVRSLEERLEAGQADEVTEAQLEQLVKVTRRPRDHR